MKLHKTHLTLNHLMILMDIYRGTFNINRHMADANNIIDTLLEEENSLIEKDGEKLQLTKRGDKLIERLLKDYYYV